jgi:hypothetical protein
MLRRMELDVCQCGVDIRNNSHIQNLLAIFRVPILLGGGNDDGDNLTCLKVSTKFNILRQKSFCGDRKKFVSDLNSR